jgi:hypothetical protein
LEESSDVLVILTLYRKTAIDAVDILSVDGIVRASQSGRRSSVVERTIGNGEVESSILSGGTISLQNFLRIPPRSGGLQGLPDRDQKFRHFSRSMFVFCSFS